MMVFFMLRGLRCMSDWVRGGGGRFVARFTLLELGIEKGLKSEKG
jgi:hypothetical protein